MSETERSLRRTYRVAQAALVVSLIASSIALAIAITALVR